MGHYKVVLSDNDIANLHKMMINIGLVYGVALPRWKKFLDIMIEKVKGVSKIHRPGIIQLFGTDFNFSPKTIFGDKLMRFSLNHCSMKASQNDSKRGHLCYLTVLNKILTYDILRLTK